MTQRPGADAVGMLVHPVNPAAQETARRIRQRLDAVGVPWWEASTRDGEAAQAQLPGTRLLLVLGGDGSLMRAAQLTAPLDIPVVAVSLGRLGFLAELTPENVEALLPEFLAGNYWLDRRLMLDVTLTRPDGTRETALAANDAVVTNPAPSRVLDVTVFVDDARVTTYVADAYIVSTPTGSTAYNLAAHGPIVAPWAETMVLTPVAPHLSSIDTLVVSADARVTLRCSAREGAVLTTDGQQDFTVGVEDTISIAASTHTLGLARVRPRNYFYSTLVGRLIRREQWSTNAGSG